MDKLSIFELTSQSFADSVHSLLKKGSLHALRYYSSVMQKGDGLSAFDPKEPQSKAIFETLEELTEKPQVSVKSSLKGSDTEKWVLSFSDGMIAELVVIPMKTGLTLCVSSQVGCRMACAFCETGRMGRLRDLTTQEIIAQVFFAKHTLKKPIKNIVFMGMGEPFDNYHNLTQALAVLTDQKGFNFPAKRITVSTSGLVPRIYDFIAWGKRGVKLAISVNGSNDQNRSLVMPVNRRYNMQTLKEALIEFAKLTSSKVLAEYVMMQGINDDTKSALELSAYLDNVPCLVNLIPYNAQSHDKFAPPSDLTITSFKQTLIEKGHRVYVRQNKGNAIMAACGQLGQLDLKKSLLQKEALFLR